MVTVGSLDAWLEVNRHGDQDRSGSSRRPAAAAQSAPTTPGKALSLISVSTLALSADLPATSSTTSLLTAQLSDAGFTAGASEVLVMDPTCANVALTDPTRGDCGSSGSYGDFCLLRAASQPELQHGDSWSYPAAGCMLLSSPLMATSLSAIEEDEGQQQKQQKPAEQQQQHHHQPVSTRSACLPAPRLPSTAAAACSDTGYFDWVHRAPEPRRMAPAAAAGDAAGPHPPLHCGAALRWSEGDAAAPLGPTAGPHATLPAAGGDLVVPLPAAAAATGCRTSSKHDVYDRTVRGGHPRRAACCYRGSGQDAFLTPLRRASSSGPEVEGASGGAPAPPYLRCGAPPASELPPPTREPLLLSDMLRLALNRR
ncbi:hypothetical protein Agub_g10365 [Astrephomene gubernaculifera]|uniref:Uncharacterized protein n=1 Tax=Astrephomene gubernaculifera TaxID=47775 RepID=A0AAD3DXB6_9CHLO|nr:hypothetical protein Agub_g10365 [Astrephomene gubernaculifera]